MATIEVTPVKETNEDFDAIEALIVSVFREALYMPLLFDFNAPLAPKVMSNSRNDLLARIASGRIYYEGGSFKGAFNASISKELKALGAQWDKRSGSFRIPKSDLPMGLRQAIAASSAEFEKRLTALDAKLAKILPEEIAEKVQATKLFDIAIEKTDKDLNRTLERITVSAELTPERRRIVAEEWQTNLQLWIKDFTGSEIVKLRKEIQRRTLRGDRHAAVVKAIQKSFGTSVSKARFLARQETSLLLTKLKEVRYREAGSTEYRWGCVVGSKHHPVRPSHKKLEGKIFSWSNPPITTETGQPVRRNNPGQDYNCRCFAKPIVRFRESTE